MDTTELSLDSLELQKLEAFIEIMFLAAYADGTIQEAERDAFRTQMTTATGGQLGADLVEAVLAQLERSLASGNLEERFIEIRRRLPDPRMRKAALALAVRVVLADGVLGVDEAAFLKRAATALELDQDAAGAHSTGV